MSEDVAPAGSAPGVPLTLALDGQRVVCVGAGPVATDKLTPFLDGGAGVSVIAPVATPAVRAADAAGRLRWERRVYERGDLRGALLVIAGTADAEVNDAVAAEAAQVPLLCLRVDGGGTAALAAAVRRGPLTITVSTQGKAPALARRLRADIEETYGPEYGALVELLGQLRSEAAVRQRLATVPKWQRGDRWRGILETDILEVLRNGDLSRARKVALDCLFLSSD